MFQAIEIEGEPYWDGGFVVMLKEEGRRSAEAFLANPRVRQETPRTATEILNRVNEVSFNSPLMKELHMIALLRQAADPGTGEGARWARMLTHWIYTDKLAEFRASSKLNAERAFLDLD
jgi:NTE family protein